MKKSWIIILMLIGVFTFFSSSSAYAADLAFHLGVAKQTDGTWRFEVWYNDHVLWRLALLSDGAKPVLTQKEPNTVSVAPHLDDGFFMLKIDHEN